MIECDVEQAVLGKGLAMVFQPIVTLPDQTCIGYEALARWPALPECSPAVVFARAERAGSLDLLEVACIEAAAAAAFEGEYAPGMLLTINSEPSVAHIDGVGGPSLTKAASEFAVAFELTERGLLTHPHEMLRKVAELRADGFAVALDDVGAHPDSLALLDVVAPDIIKLDLQLIQKQPDRTQARTLGAVLAHHERTGAAILAEGIETEEHLEQALAYGATLGQGYRFGRPGALNIKPTPWRSPAMAPMATMSFHDLMTSGLPVRTVRTQTLVAFTRQLERLAGAADSPPMVLTVLQHVRNYSGLTRRVYRDLAASSPFVAIFGEAVPSTLDHRVRGVALDNDDPLCREWAIVILGPDSSAALIAREVDCVPAGGATADCDRRFEMTITFDRNRVASAARMLLDRMT